MSLLIEDVIVPPPPNLPLAPVDYESRYQEQFNNVLRLYFNRLDAVLRAILATTSPIPVSIGGTNIDAFGRMRVSNPLTLFDSSHRYADNNLWANSITGTAAATFNADEPADRRCLCSAAAKPTARAGSVSVSLPRAVQQRPAPVLQPS